MSRRFQLLEVGTERCPARDSRWSGAAACLNRFRGFSESILNWEKYILQCTDESICLAKRCCLHLFLSPCLVCWWHAAVRLCGGLVLPDWVFFIYLFIFFPLHIKACLRCVLAAWKARWKSGTLLNQVKLCGSAVHKCQNESIHNNVHEAEILNVQVHIRPKYERVHERSFTECVQTQHWHISIVCRITLVTLLLATRLNIYL